MLNLYFFRCADMYQPTSIGGTETNNSGIEDTAISDGTEGEDLFGGAPKHKDTLPRDKGGKQALPAGSIVGIDFDGTLNLAPAEFKRILDEVAQQGGRSHIITARPESEAHIVKEFCGKHGIVVHSMHFYPEYYTYDEYLADTKGWNTRSGNWKAAVARSLGATVMIDDLDVCLAAVGRENPGIMLLKPEDSNGPF